MTPFAPAFAATSTPHDRGLPSPRRRTMLGPNPATPSKEIALP